MAKSPVNHQQLTSSPWTLLLFHPRDFSSILTTFSTCIQGSLEHSQGQLSGTNGWKLVGKDPKFPVTWWDKSMRILHGVPENAQLDWPLVALHVNHLSNILYWLFSFPVYTPHTLTHTLSLVLSETTSQQNHLHANTYYRICSSLKQMTQTWNRSGKPDT